LTIPFAAATPVPMTHRFFGRSIADLVMPTQREKTAMKRGALDNMYMHNNPRVEVAEANAGPNTLDDLLVSRPGGVIRVNWQDVPDVTPSIFNALQFLDMELQSRTGLTKQAQGIDANALQNQSATAVNQVFSASQMRLKLVARVLAEGVRDIFSLMHATIRKHGQQAQTVKLRNQWIDVDPRGWRTRDDMTINVGLGTGGKAQQFAQTMAIANVQKEMVAAGKTNMVGDRELYSTAAELTRIMGHKNPNRFFKDPTQINPQTGQLANPPPAAPVDPKVQAIQAKAQADQQSAQRDAVHQQVKMQAEIELARIKAALDAKSALLDAHLKAAGEARAAHHDNQLHRLQLAGDVAGIIAQAHAHNTDMARKRAVMSTRWPWQLASVQVLWTVDERRTRAACALLLILAVQPFVSCLGYTGCGADRSGKAACNPKVDLGNRLPRSAIFLEQTLRRPSAYRRGVERTERLMYSP
jgi:hypothetical protein